MIGFPQKRASAATHRRTPSFRPRLEQLENREVPSTSTSVIGFDAAGLEHLFVLGQDHQVYQLDLNSSGTAIGGYHLAATGQVKSFKVVQDHLNNMHLFAVGLDNQLYQLLFNSSGQPSSSYSTTMTGQITALEAGRDTFSLGDPEIFAIGGDNQVYTIDFNADGSIDTTATPTYTLITPGQVKSITVAENGDPTTAATHFPEVFAIASDNQVYLAAGKSAIATFNPYALVAAGQVRSITVTTDHLNNMHLYALGQDSQVYQVLFNTSAAPTSSYLLTRPGQVKAINSGRDGQNDPVLFAEGMDNQIYLLDFNADGTLFNGTPTYTLTASGQVTSFTVGKLARANLFITGADNQVYEAIAPVQIQTFNPYFLVQPGQVVP
jgi:hypothetical protein